MPASAALDDGVRLFGVSNAWGLNPSGNRPPPRMSVSMSRFVVSSSFALSSGFAVSPGFDALSPAEQQGGQ